MSEKEYFSIWGVLLFVVGVLFITTLGGCKNKVTPIHNTDVMNDQR